MNDDNVVKAFLKNKARIVKKFFYKGRYFYIVSGNNVNYGNPFMTVVNGIAKFYDPHLDDIGFFNAAFKVKE